MEGLQTEGAQQSTLAGRGGGSGGQTEVLLPRSSCIPHHVPPCSHAHFIKPAWSLSLRFPSLANVAMQWHCVCACVCVCVCVCVCACTRICMLHMCAHFVARGGRWEG